MGFSFQKGVIDLKDTPVSNIFIDRYLAEAEGSFLKVYLMGLKAAFSGYNDNNDVLARRLKLSIDKIDEAWDYWEKKGLIKKTTEIDGYGVEFIELKELYIYEISESEVPDKKPEIVEDPNSERLEAAIENKDIVELFNHMSEIFNRVVAYTEHIKVLEWIYDYNMSTELIREAFELVRFDKNKKTINYVEGIIKNWRSFEIFNIEQLKEYQEEMEPVKERYRTVLKSLGMTRPATQGEMIVIDKWVDTYGFSKEIILKACESTTGIYNPNIKYVDAILDGWHSKGVKSLADIDNIKENEKEKSKKTKKTNRTTTKTAKSTHFHNFSQHSDTYSNSDLEKKAEQKRKNYMEKKTER